MADAFLDYSRAIIREAPRSIDFETIRAENSVSSVIGSVVKLIKAGREYKACCPFHADRSPSFYVNDAKGFYHCFGCGAHGDVLDFLVNYDGLSIAEAAEQLGTGAYVPSSAPRPRFDPAEPDPSNRTDEAIAIWRASVPIEGTPAQQYLRRRAISIPIPEALRFARIPLGKRSAMPAMIALVTDGDGIPCGIQRTYLTDAGVKANLPGGKVKFSLGQLSGGAIRLGPCGPEIVIAEGIEDGASLLQMGAPTVFVSAGAGMMPNMRLSHGVRSVIIGADADAAGEDAAQKAAHAFAGQGRSVRIIRPTPPFNDFNAELMAQNKEAANGR